jgi:diadenosine tetraphosphate (Ap4A) HIT family hydrolase
MTEAKACPMCELAASGGDDPTIVYQDEHWLARSISSKPAVAGWLLLQARRHIGDSGDFNAAEAASFGSVLQRTTLAVREATGALRVYIASLNEGNPHFHSHVLPRLDEMPNGAVGFDAFGLSALARRGEVQADPEQVSRILADIRERLKP